MNNKTCCVCEFDSAKYKCPKCKQFYCSVSCYNKHKEKCIDSIELKNCEIDEDPIERTNIAYNFPTDDTVPIEKLEELRYNEEIKNCLKNSQVRDIITHVLKDNNPTRAIAHAMTDPMFVEFADTCLKIVESSNKEKPC